MNNADLGMTLQAEICRVYGIEPVLQAKRQFLANSRFSSYSNVEPLISDIFKELDTVPCECLTFRPSDNPGERLNPHNFLLKNGKTLSIRTNKGNSSSKIAPRVVGQCGIDQFNYHFSDIIGATIKDKQEIKRAVFENIHKMLPIFIDYMLISDYTIWVKEETDGSYSYTTHNREEFADIDFSEENFCFTKSPLTWNESTTLKYKGKSLAEIQIHTNRTFKFRFFSATLSNLLREHKETNETFGISAEVSICNTFKLDIPKQYKGRYFNSYVNDMIPIIKDAFYFLPKPIECTGAKSGTRGKASKSPNDFLLDNSVTLSLKTNSKSICPDEVGQPGAETCYLFFKDFIDGEQVTAETFKKMVYNHIAEIMPIYVKHLFLCDYMLWIHKKRNKYVYSIYEKSFADGICWDSNLFSFTKSTIEEWNESNTVKYNDISIGEFQVHNNRSSFKFRFNMENFEKVLKLMK